MTSALRLIRQVLVADANVMAEANAVFAIKAKQGSAPPFIVIDLVSEEEFLRALAGGSGQYEARVAVACHSKSASGADAMAETVKAAIGDLLNYPVIEAGIPLGTVETWMAGASTFDWSEDGTIYRRIVDFGVRWKP